MFIKTERGSRMLNHSLPLLLYCSKSIDYFLSQHSFFSFAMMSCTGNKTTNAASEGEETTVETVEAVVETDSCCQAKDSCATACDKKADCAEKKECCDKK